MGGRDLHRAEHGTWLGVTKQGRLACLTNFREEGAAFIQGKRSRGAIVNAYLRLPPDHGQHQNQASRQVAEQLIADGLSGVGGFSLLFGRLRRPSWRVEDAEKRLQSDTTLPLMFEQSDFMRAGHWEGLAIVSNRSEHVNDVKWLCRNPGETHALSNSHYGDNSWPKVVHAEQAVAEAIKTSSKKNESKDAMIARLIDVLSTDTLPRQKNGEEWDTYLGQLRQSIFIPPIGKDAERKVLNGESPLPNGAPHVQAAVDMATSGVYGTQKQSIVLVDWEGNATVFERTLIDVDGKPVSKGKGDLSYEFRVEGW